MVVKVGKVEEGKGDKNKKMSRIYFPHQARDSWHVCSRQAEVSRKRRCRGRLETGEGEERVICI